MYLHSIRGSHKIHYPVVKATMDERQQARGETGTGSAERSDNRESAKEGDRKLDRQTLELTRSHSHQALEECLPPFDF